MKKFFGKLFSGPETAREIIAGAKDGLDALIFTDEEKSQASMKAWELYIRWIEATQGHNMARRFLAILIASLWVLTILLSILFKVLEQTIGWMEGSSDFVFRVLEDHVNMPFLAVMGFYFATQLLQRSIGAAKSDK